MTASAHRGGHFDPRSKDGIIRIGGVIGGTTMAILALNAGEFRGCSLARKSCRRLIPNRMTGQTTGITVLMGLLECFECEGMSGIHNEVMNFPVTFRTCLRARVLR